MNDNQEKSPPWEDGSIREMDVEDLGEVLPIAATAPFNPWSRDMFLGEMRHPLSHCFLVFGTDPSQSKTVLGFICFRTIEEESELLNIGIHPSERRKGLGKKLMNVFITFGQKHRAKKYYLEVHPSNRPAIRLYESFDFKIAGKRKNFYLGTDDAIVMERESDRNDGILE